MGHSPWGHKELDMTEHVHTHTHSRCSTLLSSRGTNSPKDLSVASRTTQSN